MKTIVTRSAPVAAMSVVFVATLLAGCARTEVHSDRGGLKYYPVSRPVMVVTATDDCGNPIKADVAYVPDTSRPRYVRQQSGMGNHGWKLTCENGIANSFEQSASDSKIPETIGSLADAGVAFLAGRSALKELDVIEK